MNIKNCVDLKCYVSCKAHSTEQAPFTRMFPYDTHLSAESTEAMRIKSHTEGHNILMHPAFEPLVAVSRNRHLAYLTTIP